MCVYVCTCMCRVFILYVCMCVQVCVQQGIAIWYHGGTGSMSGKVDRPQAQVCKGKIGVGWFNQERASHTAKRKGSV